MRFPRVSRGFTLIELLVVIAIIGILSSVVLASLNSARNRGADAAIKSQMGQARVQGELYYSTYGTYNRNSAVYGNDDLPGCTTDAAAANSVLNPTDGIGKFIESALGNHGSGTRPLCRVSAPAYNSWAVAIPLKNPSGSNTGWCVDSSGAAKEVSVVFDVSQSGQLASGNIARCP